MAILSNYQENSSHEDSLQGKASWCRLNKNKATGENIYWRIKVPLPVGVAEDLKTPYE